jgi:hypothetical protein
MPVFTPFALGLLVFAASGSFGTVMHENDHIRPRIDDFKTFKVQKTAKCR